MYAGKCRHELKFENELTLKAKLIRLLHVSTYKFWFLRIIFRFKKFIILLVRWFWLVLNKMDSV